METHKIKMVGLDLDGTLLTRDKRITKYTSDIIERALNEGVIVLPATGRPFSGVPKEIIEFPGLRYVLSSNGARVVDLEEDKVLIERLLPYDAGEKLLHIFQKYDALLEIYYDGMGYAQAEELRKISRYLPESPMAAYIASTRNPVEDVVGMFHEKKRPTDKVQAIFSNQEEKEAALREIEESGLEVEVTGALRNNIEVNAKGVNKGEALIRLGEMLGIKREEIMAVGDGANDTQMLKEAGLGVAMGNSMDEVKAAADKVTCSNSEDGAAKAILKYVLQ